MSKTPTLFLTTLPVEGDGRERARGRQFSREKSGKSRSIRRRCGRSSADTFERVPVVGAEMGGHGEARLAGPDTAISGARGIETVAQSFARLEFFQVSFLRAASDSKRQIGPAWPLGLAREKKSPRFARKNRPGRVRAQR